MTVFVISKFGIGFVGGEEALGGSVAIPPCLDFECWFRLNIAVPVGVFAICRDDDAFSGGLIVANNFEHGVSNSPSLATLVDQHEKPMAE